MKCMRECRRYPGQLQGRRSLRRNRAAREDTVESRATTSPWRYLLPPHRVNTSTLTLAFSARKCPQCRICRKLHTLAATVLVWEAGNHLPCIGTTWGMARPLPCREPGRRQGQRKSTSLEDRSMRWAHLLNPIRTGCPHTVVECRFQDKVPLANPLAALDPIASRFLGRQLTVKLATVPFGAAKLMMRQRQRISRLVILLRLRLSHLVASSCP